MSKLHRSLPMRATAMLVALLALVAGTGHAASAADTAQPAQRIVVSARDSALVVTGAGSAKPGFVRIVVRNDARGQHGIELVRLKRSLTTPQLLRAFAAEQRRLIESLGGIQQVAAGRPWEMTARLAPGSYAFIDFGQNGPKPNYANGLFKRFRIGSSPAVGAPPAAVGEIEMHDFRFDFRLPKPFAGHGIVKIPNLGKTSHEITLVRIDPGHTQQEVLELILAGATKPPKWASLIELLSVLDPGRTAYVRLDLPPGRYVALCLLDEPAAQKLHAQLGMIGNFDVN
jgi:hypothetical protein